ncbi:MAG: hypothetical protein GY795_31940 [Desulfobacterales bacterium]|nr:hypothetical protein [Desulfobacterales bacterium]
MWEDPIVKEVRKIRENLEAEFNFETKAIFNDIRQRQSALGSRLVCRKKQNQPNTALKRTGAYGGLMSLMQRIRL